MLQVAHFCFDRNDANILHDRRIRPGAALFEDSNLRFGIKTDRFVAAGLFDHAAARRAHEAAVGHDIAAIERLPLPVDDLQDRTAKLGHQPVVGDRQRRESD